MAFRCISLTLLSVLAAGDATGTVSRLRIGDPLPELVLPRAAGGQLRLRDLHGQTLAVSFFSQHCPPCRKELPVLERVVERVNRGLPPERQIIPLVISIDARVKASSSIATRWLLDPQGKARAAFDPRTFPSTFLIDDGGIVRHINRGFGAGYEARVERWLRRMTVAARGAR